VWSGTAALALKTYAGDPNSPIWTYFKSTGDGGPLGSLIRHGAPLSAEQAAYWPHPKVPSTPVGNVQDFEGPRGVGETITWSPLYGAQSITDDYRKVWLTRQGDLGPAKGPVVRAGEHSRQDFVGGYILHNGFSEATYVGGTYCFEVNDMLC
jgi:hypothetical protein